MTSPALNSFATFLSRGDGATPENYTLIAEVGEITGPSMKANLEEVTSHSSVNGFEEFIPTTLSWGDLKFPINFVPTNSTHSYTQGLLKDFYNRTLRNFKLAYPDGTIWYFTGYVVGFEMKAAVKGRLTADLTITVTTGTLA